MPRRRKRKLLAPVLAALAVGVAVAVWPAPKPPPRWPYPCRETFEWVTVGMPRDEVYATVGGPPGTYTLTGSEVSGQTYYYPFMTETWAGPDGGLLVVYDGHGRVGERYLDGAFQKLWNPSWFDRLRTRLGL